MLPTGGPRGGSRAMEASAEPFCGTPFRRPAFVASPRIEARTGPRMFDDRGWFENHERGGVSPGTLGAAGPKGPRMWRPHPSAGARKHRCFRPQAAPSLELAAYRPNH